MRKQRLARELRAGSLLASRFRLVRPVGRGAVGDVWLGIDTQLNDEPVACKVLNAIYGNDRRAISDLKREVLMARRLRHPHIVSIHTFWDAEGYRFITMDYVSGPNMAAHMSARTEPFRIEDVLPWVRQLCDALGYAHEQGVLHRDVKPANILLDADNSAHLADFGIARLLIGSLAHESGHVTSGTLLYMSPEQLFGEAMDGRSDLYSLAAAVYEWLAGRPPFFRGSILEQIHSRLPDPIPHCHEAINRVLLRALSKAPGERPATCGAFYEELAAVVGYIAETPAPKHREALKRHYDPEAVTVEIPQPARERGPKRMGEILLNSEVVTQRQLEDALREQEERSEPLGAVLVRLGYATERTIAQAIAEQMQMPLVSLDEETIEAPIARILPHDAAVARRCLPMRREGDRLLVAMADPLNFEAINLIEETYGAPIEPRIATECEILAAIARVHDS